MPAQRATTGTEHLLRAGEAARLLNISIDTLRRWDRRGRIRTERDAANRRLVPHTEVERLRQLVRGRMSARNRFAGIVRDVKVDGLLAQIEIDVVAPARVVAVITREAVDALGLERGVDATAVVKATSVMVER